LQAAQEGDAKHPQENKENNGKKPRRVKVPVADPDSAVMPNKEGGYAPNYNPVAREDWGKLPRRPQSENKLDRAAFVYEAGKDVYSCPMGRELAFAQTKTKGRTTGDDSEYRVYQCESCAGCELAGACLAGKSARRTVSHDQHEPVRREVAVRMKTESGKQTYARRAHLAETPSAFIKQVIGLRQFFLRGLEKVRMEWLWACAAFNIRKLVLARERMRAVVGVAGANVAITGAKVV